MISQVPVTSKHRAARETERNLTFFLLVATDIVVFGTIYSTCVVYKNYTKTIIIHLDVDK